jgi:methylase of polypeptide subunit release factors
MVNAPRVDPAAVGRLRQALEAADYTDERIRQVLGVDPVQTGSHFDALVYARRIAEPTRLHSLVRLFILGLPVALDRAAEAFLPLDLGDAEGLGLIRRDGDAAVRDLALTMTAGLWLVHGSTSEDTAPAPDHVLGPGPASRTLAALTVRQPGGRALDLGTGCGIQALLAAGHADRVVATDVNEKALYCTELNALLNDVDRIELRSGSFFGPVEDEAFDLVVSNPPFVISPDTSFEYRDAGMRGDDVSRDVARGAAGHLSAGGFATVLCNWIVREDEQWQDAPARWVNGLGCDAMVIHSESQDPLTYAATWLTRTRGPEYGAALDRWLEYHRSLRTESIVTGAVVLRRRSDGEPWILAHHVSGVHSENASDHLLRLFRNQNYLERVGGDRELLDGRFRLAADAMVEESLVPHDGGWGTREATMRLGAGLAFEGRSDPFVLQVLGGCDGTHRLRDLVRHAARASGLEEPSIAPRVVEVVRQVLSLGFLEAPRTQGGGAVN